MGTGFEELITFDPGRTCVRVGSKGLSEVAEVAWRWQAALARTVDGSRRLSVLYSGGLDSSLVAVAARSLAPVELVTVGVTGCPDLAAGKLGADMLGLEWVGRAITLRDVETILQSDRRPLEGKSPVARSVLVGLALGLNASTHTQVLCGQGADELFLGYAHFEGLSDDQAMRRREIDLERLLTEDWPASAALGEVRGKRLGSPFLDPDFVRYARSLSIERLRSGEGRKPLLREVARTLGVPSELAGRPKKAFQYGSGIHQLLKLLGSPAG
jgi:asparagine synthase (glutamine-hydrolysing)